MRSTASNMRSIRSGASGQYWATMCSLRASPEPIPSQCRPGNSAAVVAEAWATTAGCHRKLGVVTPGPRSPVVCSPIAARTLQTKGACPCSGVHGWKWSAAMTPEKPWLSAWTARSTASRGGRCSSRSERPIDAMGTPWW